MSISGRVLPTALYDLACQLFPSDGPLAMRRLEDALSADDLRRLAVIVVDDGIEAARRFYMSRPRRLRKLRVVVGRPAYER